MAELITCPSGLSGSLRGMKVREEKILVDRKLAKSGGQLDELLRACWEDTVDPGPYAFEGPRPDWGAAWRIFLHRRVIVPRVGGALGRDPIFLCSAAEQAVSDAEGLRTGMEQKSREFSEAGAAIYSTPL